MTPTNSLISDENSAVKLNIARKLVVCPSNTQENPSKYLSLKMFVKDKKGSDNEVTVSKDKKILLACAFQARGPLLSLPLDLEGGVSFSSSP